MTHKRVRKPTTSQLKAIKYCEEMLCITFEGNANNYDDCEEFLREYLSDAEQTEKEFNENISIYLNYYEGDM